MSLQLKEATFGTEEIKNTTGSRFERRRTTILDAASALFNRHGLRDATLAVIAAEIGLNLKSLRYYYERREDLVAAAFMRSIELHETLAKEASVKKSIEERIDYFVRSYLHLLTAVRLEQRPEFVYFGDLRALTEPHAEVVWAAYSRMFKTIRQLLQSPKVTWKTGRLNAATHMLLSQLLWTPVWTDEYFAQDTEYIAQRFVDTLLYGIAAAPIDVSSFAAPLLPAPAEEDKLSQETFLRTATTLINRLGYRGASVDRISAELNVTKGAFYHHNETRDELVVASFEHSFARIREAQDAAWKAERSGMAQITAAGVCLVRQQMIDTGTLLRTSALTCVGPEVRMRMAGQMSRLTLRFGNMLNDGIIDGSVRPCNVRIAAEMTTAMINSSEELGRWVKSATVHNAAELYVRPLLTGLIEFMQQD